MKISIWTRIKTPFALGGTHQSIATDVEPESILELSGCKFAVIQNTVTSGWHIAEISSGGLVFWGKTKDEAIEMLRKAVDGFPEEQLRSQIEKGLNAKGLPENLAEHDFWSRFKP